jgi:hypothetical protein
VFLRRQVVRQHFSNPAPFDSHLNRIATSATKGPEDYVPMMPYLQVFVVGEVLRRGVMGAPDRRAGVYAFLILFSLSQYIFFAPLYWFWIMRKAQGKPICQVQRGDIEMLEFDGGQLESNPSLP